MAALRNWSLRSEIVISLALLVAAAVGLIGLVVLKQIQPRMIALKVETGLVMAKAIEARLILDPSDGSLDKLLESLASAGFEHIVVVDPAGETLVSIGPEPRPPWPKKTDLREAVQSRRVLTFLDEPGFLPFGHQPTLALAVPMFDGMRPVGAVGLHSSLAGLRRSWAQIEWIIFIYLTLDTAVTVLFGTYVLNRRLVQPLQRMVNRVRALAEGEFQPGRTLEGEGHEIGRLERSFETMAVKLLESRARLEKNLASLEAAQESLVRSEKMATVGRLAAGLAHELGNPLGSMVGFIHLLRRDDLTEAEREDFLGRMEAETGRMDAIIRALLDFARPTPVRIEPLDLNQVASDALALASVQKWSRGLDIRRDMAPGPVMALGEANRLIQVLLNLLVNAGQAMDGQGELTIRTVRRDDKVLVAVIDGGAGIDPADLPHIFEPFFTRKPPGQGTGLGLSVSQSIVESLGGRIEVESRPGRGSVFTVVLPADESGGQTV
ncbi:MAG: HAMP domain-containing protein [Proteobacteria bacterium]|nr:HAMP domain-containing protein [Pseudomonadota bacterium]